MKTVSHKEISLKDRNGQWLQTHHSEGRARGQLILIAEDSEADIFFLLRVMDQAGVLNPIYVVRNGTEALAYLEGTGRYADRAAYPLPGIVLVDLKMPGIDGFEILRWKRRHRDLRNILMVAVSSYDGVYGINLAYETGADTFLSKPLASEDVLNLISAFNEYWELVHSADPSNGIAPKTSAAS
jgi:CheY-like chemotaxis protein